MSGDARRLAWLWTGIAISLIAVALFAWYVVADRRANITAAQTRADAQRFIVNLFGSETALATLRHPGQAWAWHLRGAVGSTRTYAAADVPVAIAGRRLDELIAALTDPDSYQRGAFTVAAIVPEERLRFEDENGSLDLLLASGSGFMEVFFNGNRIAQARLVPGHGRLRVALDALVVENSPPIPTHGKAAPSPR